MSGWGIGAWGLGLWGALGEIEIEEPGDINFSFEIPEIGDEGEAAQWTRIASAASRWVRFAADGEGVEEEWTPAGFRFVLGETAFADFSDDLELGLEEQFSIRWSFNVGWRSAWDDAFAFYLLFDSGVNEIDEMSEWSWYDGFTAAFLAVGSAIGWSGEDETGYAQESSWDDISGEDLEYSDASTVDEFDDTEWPTAIDDEVA